MNTLDSLFVTGSLVVSGSFTVPSNSIGNTQVTAGAGITATKLQQQRNKNVPLCDHATNAAVKRLGMARVYGATGTVVKFGVLASVAAGASTNITVDLKKNGTTILSATITLDNGTAANVLKEPSGFTSTALVVGDVLDCEITAVSGANLPKGVQAILVYTEDPS